MIVIANWKMNKNKTEVNLFMNEFSNKLNQIETLYLNKRNILFSPSFPFLSELQSSYSDTFSFVAQNCSHHKYGAYTGEVSVDMIKSININYVMIGHSERRIYFGESSEILIKKINLCLDNDITPIVCFGESIEERKSNNHLDAIKNQLNIVPLNNQNKLILAYEPIWSIGTGLVPSVNEIKEVHSFVKSFINAPILYGGSLNNKNCDEIFNIHEVDGGLIGGASLLPDTFISIITKANEIFKNSIKDVD
tara:strand:- start:658 stop:1407 length:750 start_codon:yes stop_codon:yes gene_type:complete